MNSYQIETFNKLFIMFNQEILVVNYVLVSGFIKWLSTYMYFDALNISTRYGNAV